MNPVAQQLVSAAVAHQGCRTEIVEEAAPLEQWCDAVLTRHDGMIFSLLCIVDAEHDSSKRFEMERAAAKAILAACCERYAGTLVGAKQPVPLVIVEVRAGATAEDIARLRGYSNTFFDKNAIHAFLVDTVTKRVITATK